VEFVSDFRTSSPLHKREVPLSKIFWRRFWTFTCKNSNLVCFGGFPRKVADAKVLRTVTFAFKDAAKLCFIAVCRQKGCTVSWKKNHSAYLHVLQLTASPWTTDSSTKRW